MSVFQLGIVAALLSESLISGFMTGAAVHVLVSQLKDIVGIKIGRITGVLKIGKVYCVDIIDFFIKKNVYILFFKHKIDYDCFGNAH